MARRSCKAIPVGAGNATCEGTTADHEGTAAQAEFEPVPPLSRGTRRPGSGKGRGSPYFAAPAFNAGVQLEYSRRYAEDLARVQALLPPGTRWMDSHCHLESILQRTWRGGGKPQVVEHEPLVGLEELVASWPSGLDGCICNCVFKRSSKPDARALSEWEWIQANLPKFGDGPVGSKLWFTIGLHPHDAANWDAQAEAMVRTFCQHPRCVAVGECGLDFFKHSGDAAGEQEHAFRKQAALAVELGKPLVVHARKAERLCMQVLRDIVPRQHPVHIHCFSDSLEHALELCDGWENLRIGFTGSVTFKLAKGSGKTDREGPGHEVLLKGIPLERLLLETDGPYMCPSPFRGQTAHPGHVHRVAERIAEVKGVRLVEVMAATRESCRVVYGI